MYHALMLSIKPLLISTTALSAAVILKFYFPSIAKFAVYQLPSIYNAVASWLQPPYLYLLLNGIIITIVASSKLQSTNDDASTAPPVAVKESPTDYPIAVSEVEKRTDSEGHESLQITKTEPEDLRIGSENKNSPPVYGRPGHRRNSKSSPEGGGGESRIGERKETLASVWKSITEGPVPGSRQLRKSETWEGTGGGAGDVKTMTASQSQEDLNRRVEEFIAKFNQEMRLQRQASLNQHH